MRKYATLILAGIIIGTTPVIAADAETTALPKALTDLGITAEDLKDVDSAVIDTPTSQEADIMQYYRRRYCPRGYRLRAYRFRIGRFVIVRYRCERRYRRGWDYNQAPTTQQQPAMEQTIQ